MLLSLAALVLAVLLMVGLAAVAVRREVVALSEWTHALAARRADAYETVVLSAGPVALAAETAAFVDRHDADVAVRREARTESEAQEKQETEFLARVSEELLKTLAALKAGVAELSGGAEGAPTVGQREQIGTMELASRHLEAVLGDALGPEAYLTGRLPVRAAPLDVAELLGSAAAILGALTEDRAVEVRVDVQGEGLCVFADPARLLQVLLNVGAFVVRATDRGTVTLTARALGGDSGPGGAGSAGGARKVAIAIAGGGPTATVAELTAATAPFTPEPGPRAERSALAFHLAKAGAEAMGGALSFDVPDGAAPCVRITLPEATP